MIRLRPCHRRVVLCSGKTPALLDLFCRKEAPLDLKQLEDQVRDRRLTFKSFRVCQHGNDARCLGLWHHHRDNFAAGHIAQRPRLVEFVR
jgi:hypothetical protein